MTTPYQPFQPMSPVRGLYSSVVQVTRLVPTLGNFSISMAWSTIPDIVDPVLDTPGLLACRLAVGTLRPGKDQLPPIVAGRPPDRVALMYFDMALSMAGLPLVKSGDRFLCISGPITGTWELRNIPDQLQGYRGAAHCEVQVIEVAQQLLPGSPTPFPGSPT